MGTITDNKGNFVGAFEDTLEDWKQAAGCEAKLRREFQDECARLRAENATLRSVLESVREWTDFDSELRAKIDSALTEKE